MTIYCIDTHYQDNKPTDAQLTSTKILPVVTVFSSGISLNV